MTAWHDYGEDVKGAKIPASKRLKQAVDRYFSDLNVPRYTFDSATVERFIAFSRLCPHVKGPLRGQPIELEPWQQFAFACLLGFRVKATGRRKYKSAYIHVPRKNAKSTVAAMLTNCFLVMEHGQQDIYTACTSYSPRQHWPERKVVQGVQQKQQNRQKPRFVLMLLILLKSPWGTNHKKGASPSGKTP